MTGALFTVTWRVTVWKPTDDYRWRVDAVSEHPDGDWRSALTVAREWGRYLIDDIEAGRLRIKVDPVNVPKAMRGKDYSGPVQ